MPVPLIDWYTANPETEVWVIIAWSAVEPEVWFHEAPEIVILTL